MPPAVAESPKAMYKRQSSEPLQPKERSVCEASEDEPLTSGRELCTNRSKSVSEFSFYQGIVVSIAYYIATRENDGTEREAQGVGRDLSCPRKLFLAQRKSRFFGGSLFSETSACSLARFLVTSSSMTCNFCFSFKHQIEVGLNADVSEDRLPLV